MFDDISSQASNLERAFQRGDIDDKEYDEQLDALMRLARDARAYRVDAPSPKD